MARKPKTQEAEPVEVEQDQEVEAEETADEGSGRRTMSKAAAARAALAAGVSVPREASPYIKERFGIDISPQQFSAEKCRLKQRGVDDFSSLGNHVEKRLDAPAKSGKRSEGGDADLLQSLEVMKPLIDRLGAEKVKRMVDLLG